VSRERDGKKLTSAYALPPILISMNQVRYCRRESHPEVDLVKIAAKGWRADATLMTSVEMCQDVFSLAVQNFS
jgi:hypothetical protein